MHYVDMGTSFDNKSAVQIGKIVAPLKAATFPWVGRLEG